MHTEGPQYLNDLDKRLWSAADRLRANLNPGAYTHVVLGLVFLKYGARLEAGTRRNFERWWSTRWRG